MKRLLFALSFGAVAALVGCQDSNITSPISAAPSVSTQLVKPLPIDYVIPLRGRLANPMKGKSPIEIDGEIAVSLRQIPVECAWSIFDVSTQALADLRPADTKGIIWKIYGAAIDGLLFEVEGRLEKTYLLHGRKDGMTLHVTLVITREDVVLDSMWLELSHVLQAKTL